MKPTTFSEGLQRFYARFLVGAGLAVGLAEVALVALLAFGGWPEKHYGQIIDYLGWLAIGGGALMVIVVAFLGLGGPARAIKLALGKLSIETEGDA